jgi:hypothetical protein
LEKSCSVFQTAKSCNRFFPGALNKNISRTASRKPSELISIFHISQFSWKNIISSLDFDLIRWKKNSWKNIVDGVKSCCTALLAIF